MADQPNPMEKKAAPVPRKPIKRARMVGWFDPGQLARTGLEVVVSTLFGRHSDFRLLEALVPQAGEDPFFDHTYNYTPDKDGRYVVVDKTSPRTEPEIWIDYVSDVGDGWNPTYAMAYYLGLPTLDLQLPDNKGTISTKQGTVLVFGGDEVYPTASRQVYEERLLTPYQAAYQSVGKPPHVYAVPGNHDWYDSLVAFTRLFSQQRWFAGWQTHQTRSYFAVKLPRGWWILGTDVQLGSDVDKAQVDYFNEIADKHMKPEDRIILCNAEPHWVYSATYSEYDATVYNESNLKFLDDLLGHRVRVYLAGDLHHYRRHEDPNGNQKITAGGGGAFLHPTHAPDASELENKYKLQWSFPDQKTSARLTWGNLWFGLTNWQFGLATGLIYALTLWAIKPAVGAETNFLQAAKTTIAAALLSPFEASWVLAIFVGFLLFTDTHSKPYRLIAGSLHGLTHLFAAFLIGWGALYLTVTKLGLGDNRPIMQPVVFATLMFVGGYFAGPIIMGLYLLISLNGFQRHSNEAFSALKCEDYKNFLRMKIDQNGDLTIFPIGIRRVPRKWKETKEGMPGARFVPADTRATEPELIEELKPIHKETTMAAETDARTSLWFTEEMKGFVTFGETDYQKGQEEGKKSGTALMFHLTIKTDDVDEFVTNPRHECGAEGYIRCDQLGGQRPVEQGGGIFNLFVDTSDPKRKLMLYRLFFLDGKGQPFTLTGFKDVKDDPGMDIWKDTSTLYTRILRGHVGKDQEAAAEIVAAGIINIHELDFLKQLTTFRVEGPSLAAKAKSFAEFGELFMGSLWTVYASKIPLPH